MAAPRAPECPTCPKRLGHSTGALTPHCHPDHNPACTWWQCHRCGHYGDPARHHAGRWIKTGQAGT